MKYAGIIGVIGRNGAPPSTIEDDFTSYTLNQEIPVVSSGWEYRAQRHAATFFSDGADAARFAAGAPQSFYRVFARRTEVFSPNQFASTTVKSVTSGSGGKFHGPSVRMTGNGDPTLWAECYIAAFNTELGRIELQKFTSSTLIVLANPNYTFSANDKFEISAADEATGVRLICKVNDTDLINYLDTDSDRILSGKPGFFSGARNQNDTVFIDNFRCGNL